MGILSTTPLSQLLSALLLCLPLAVFLFITIVVVTTPNPNLLLYSGMNVSTASQATLITNNNTMHGNGTTTALPETLIPPPPQSYNDEEDNWFFHVASRVRSQTPNPKKVAFMFLTTSSGLPLADLWDAFFNKTPQNLYNIYVHGESSSNGGVFVNRVLVKSKPTSRQTPTLISAARRVLAHALLHDPSNYMFVVLSPSCIPLRSFNFTYNVLSQSNRSFIEILKNEPSAYFRWAARGVDAMLPEVTLEDFRMGSQFWAITRAHAVLVVSDTELWSKFRLRCVRDDACYPEENYFPTLLSMRDRGGCIPATLTHVDWSKQFEGHPRTYRSEEVGPDLIRQLRSYIPRYGSTDQVRSDPFLFARKFAPETLPPLLRIANEVIFHDEGSVGEIPDPFRPSYVL